MSLSEINTLALPTLRSNALNPSYDNTNEAINEAARNIALRTLELTDGRATYSYESKENGIRLEYLGDVIGADGEVSYGETKRTYWVDGEWKTSSPIASQSGTGLMNLQLDHVKGATDPLIQGKVQIAWLLSDPSLDLVGYTMRTTKKREGLMREPAHIRTAVEIRLAEIVEQLVLQNPNSGLDLRQIADGLNVVGWAVRALDGAIFNTVKRVVHNTNMAVNTLDVPENDGDDVRRAKHNIPAHLLPASAEDSAIAADSDSRATEQLLAMEQEDAAVKAAKAEGEKVRSRRLTEKKAMSARIALDHFGLPNLDLPSIAEREVMSKELKENNALAYLSLRAWYNLLSGEFAEGDDEITDAWLSLWQTYSLEQAEVMMMVASTGTDRVFKIVEGLIAPADKMNTAAKFRILSAVASVSNTDVVEAAVNAYDLVRQNDSARNKATFDAAMNAAVKAGAAANREALIEKFDSALYSLGLGA